MEQDILYRRTKTERKLFSAPTVLRGHIAIIVPGLLPNFLHSCAIKSGSGLGMRLQGIRNNRCMQDMQVGTRNH